MPAHRTLSAEVLSELQSLLASEANEYSSPGASAAILIDGTVETLVTGYLNFSRSRPVDRASRFPIACIMKTVTSLAVLQAVEQGRLTLDQSIAKSFNWRHLEGALTLHHLLTHASGLTDLSVDTGDGPGCLERYALLAKDFDVRFIPGEAVSYANVGFVLSAHLLERVFASEWREVLNSWVFRRLEISDPFQQVIRNADEHIRRSDGSIQRVATHWPPCYGPAGGTYAALSPSELVKIAGVFLEFGPSFLSRELALAALNPSFRLPACNWASSVGIGWTINRDATIMQTAGGAAGSGAVLYLLPQANCAVAVMCNIRTRDESFFPRFVDVVGEAILGKGLTKSKFPNQQQTEAFRAINSSPMLDVIYSVESAGHLHELSFHKSEVDETLYALHHRTSRFSSAKPRVTRYKITQQNGRQMNLVGVDRQRSVQLSVEASAISSGEIAIHCDWHTYTPKYYKGSVGTQRYSERKPEMNYFKDLEVHR